jgi:hypothetical protein
VAAWVQQVADPLVSCLCVTEGRAAFMPWLLWNFDRQTWPRKELVILDSSPVPFESARADVRVVSAPAGSNVPVKRNLALAKARGEVVAWFDDDDWQHPHRLQVLVAALRDGCAFAGGTRSWFVDLFEAGCTRYAGGHAMVFNTAGFWTEIAREVRFNVGYRRASDTVWMREIAGRNPKGGRLLEDESLSFWLCHERNISNPRERRSYSDRMDVVRAALGAVWGDTDRQLEALRARLPPPADADRARWRIPRRNLAPEAPPPWEPATRDGRLSRRTTLLRGRSATHGTGVALYSENGASDAVDGAAAIVPASRGPARRRPAPIPERPRVQRRATGAAAVVVVSAVDAPCVEAIVPHILGQAQFPFCDRAVMVAGASSGALDAAVDGLLRAGHVDRVLRSPAADTDRGRAIVARYVADASAGDAPLPASLLADLAALELAGSDQLLLARMGAFFFTSGASWVGQALSRLRDDRSLWLVSTQAGPPLGASGTLRSQHHNETARAAWDRRGHLWRLPDAATPAFVIDRRRLWGALRLADLAAVAGDGLAGCLPAALARAGAARGALVLKGSWALHAPAAFPEFASWAPWLARLVEQGIIPPEQRGPEIRLADPSARATWQRLVERIAAAA